MSEKLDVNISSDQFEELPDAPPKSTIRLSWVGKISLIVVSIWIALAVIGPWVAPWDESHFIEEDAQGNYFLDPSFMLPNASVNSFLGTDYLGRDVLSRVIWGARITIGISFAATILAYFVAITLGIAAAVAGRRRSVAARWRWRSSGRLAGPRRRDGQPCLRLVVVRSSGGGTLAPGGCWRRGRGRGGWRAAAAVALGISE